MDLKTKHEETEQKQIHRHRGKKLIVASGEWEGCGKGEGLIRGITSSYKINQPEI